MARTRSKTCQSCATAPWAKGSTFTPRRRTAVTPEPSATSPSAPSSQATPPTAFNNATVKSGAHRGRAIIEQVVADLKGSAPAHLPPASSTPTPPDSHPRRHRTQLEQCRRDHRRRRANQGHHFHRPRQIPKGKSNPSNVTHRCTHVKNSGPTPSQRPFWDCQLGSYVCGLQPSPIAAFSELCFAEYARTHTLRTS